jgi:hypothetical protein
MHGFIPLSMKRLSQGEIARSEQWKAADEEERVTSSARAVNAGR